LGLSGRVPRRVDAAVKHELLSLIDRALADGWEHRRACAYLELPESRAWRWRRRRDAGCLDDRRAGGSPMHGLRPEEVTAILGLFEAWGEVDRSHRKLAHRGSYLGLVWVSPATVRRVLAAHDLVLKRPRRIGRSERRPFPEWASYTKNSIWMYDCTHFSGCPKHAVFAVMDLVTRKWITELVSIEEKASSRLSAQRALCKAPRLERERPPAAITAVRRLTEVSWRWRLVSGSPGINVVRVRARLWS